MLFRTWLIRPDMKSDKLTVYLTQRAADTYINQLYNWYATLETSQCVSLWFVFFTTLFDTISVFLLIFAVLQ